MKYLKLIIPNIAKQMETLHPTFLKYIVIMLFISIISPVASASSYYDANSKTIILSGGTNTLSTIYVDINNPLILSYNLTTNTYILNAKIESSGLADLKIENTTLLMNNDVDDGYYIQVGKILTVDNSTIRSVNGKRFYIWAARKVLTSGWYGTINNSIIDGGFVVFFTAKMYATSTGPPYVRVLNTTIKNVNMTGITQIIPDTSTEIWSPLSLNQRLSPLSIPFAAGTNALVQDVIFDNVVGDGIEDYALSVYGGIITITSNANNIRLKNIRIVNSSTLHRGGIFTRGSPNNFTIDNLLVENFNGEAIEWKEGPFGINNLKDITIRNTGNRAITLYLNMFESLPSSRNGAKIENLIIDGGVNKSIDTLIAMDRGNLYINVLYLWIFNAQLKNTNKVFLLRDNIYFFTNALVQNFNIMYDYPYGTGEVNWYEILDVKVVDINNKPIPGATVEIIPNNIAPQPNSVDKWFNPKTSTITDSTGHTPLPTNETGMIALLRQRDYSSGSQSTTYSYSIKASYQSSTNTVTNVVPSTSWYRTNPNTYSNTIVITLPLSTQNYSTSGYVKDPNGLGIQSAEVAENVTGHVTYTDPSGRYSLSGLVNGSYNISATRAGYSQNFRVVTISGANVANANITLILETTPPASITALLNNTYAQTYINWVWADPLDVDFSKVMIYLNGIFQTNVTKGTQSYNAVSLIPDTSYTISTHTVDSTGNINKTWVNHTARTALLPETTPPASITSLQNSSYAQNYITWTWTDPADADLSRVMVYLGGAFQTNVTKGIQSYNAASLSPETTYTISTHTVDSTGNVNMTWVNHSARTSPSSPTQISDILYDNRLRESTPNDILGTLPYSDIGHLLGTGRFRDVMWVDLSSYNSSDKITSAILSLFWYYPAGNARNYPTTVELYRPLSWDPNSVNWNNGSNGMPWTNSGGDWYDMNGAFNGSVPFTSLTFSATTLPDNRYYDFNVTGLVQDYVSGKYPNTGFFLKAKDEYDNYIAFYSSNHSNPDQRPKLTINYTTGITPSNPAPSITSFSPGSLTPGYAVNSGASFSVTTDQTVSSTWYLNGTNQNNNAQAWSHTWDIPGQYNVTYVGANGNGSVSITWNVTVVSPYDLNGDGYVNETDLEVIRSHFGQTTYAPYPSYDVTGYGIVDVYDITVVSNNILE